MNRKTPWMRGLGLAAIFISASAGAESPPALPVALPATSPATLPAPPPAARPATLPETSPSTGPTTAPATSPKPLSAADAAKIDALVAELSGTDWRSREAAQRKLVEMGESARPALQELVERTADAEVRNRAQGALGQLAEGDRTGETRVTLRLLNVPPQEVIAELARQARAPIEVWPETMWRFNPRGPVTVDIDQKPFWVATREVCEKLNLRPQAMGGERAFTLVDNRGGANPFKGPTVLSGPFMFVAGGVSESKQLTFGQAVGVGDAKHSLSLNLTLYAEPKLKVLGRSFRVDVKELTDEAGRSLTPTAIENGMAGMDAQVQGNAIDVSIPLKAGTGAKRIAKLRGTQKLVLETKTENVEFADVANAKGATRDLAGHRFTLKELMREGPGRMTLRVACAPLGGGGGLLRLPGRARQAPVVTGELRVLDAAGAVLMRSRLQFYNGQGESGISSSFEGNGRKPAAEPAKVVIEVASETREVEVPFEFTDLPLP